MKGCTLRMYASLVSQIEDNGDQTLRQDVVFRKFLFLTALQNEHSDDKHVSCQSHSILTNIPEITKSHMRFRLNLGFDETQLKKKNIALELANQEAP